jgi:hypothetical protein
MLTNIICYVGLLYLEVVKSGQNWSVLIIHLIIIRSRIQGATETCGQTWGMSSTCQNKKIKALSTCVPKHSIYENLLLVPSPQFVHKLDTSFYNMFRLFMVIICTHSIPLCHFPLHWPMFIFGEVICVTCKPRVLQRHSSKHNSFRNKLNLQETSKTPHLWSGTHNSRNQHRSCKRRPFYCDKKNNIILIVPTSKNRYFNI